MTQRDGWVFVGFPPRIALFCYTIYERIRGEMVKANVHNVILIMSDEVGARFGADCPDAVSHGGGTMIVEYAVDAARFCKSSRSDQ